MASGTPHDEPLVADNDYDSVITTNAEDGSLESLRSSILNYQKENGRTYHALSSGKYVFPNDQEENERLDLQDHLFRITFEGKRALNPGAETAKRVLDMGTGTGTWAIDYADEHPAAEVIGVDLSPIQPAFIPPNCSFEIDDLEKDWTWKKKFDFIFSRMMTGSFADPANIAQKAFESLEPGGYYEIQDLELPPMCDDGSMTEDMPIYKWQLGLAEASEKFGRKIGNVNAFPGYLRDAGFVDVTVRKFKWPSNAWPRDPRHKEIGTWQLANTDNGLEGWTLALFTRALGWTREETLVLCSQVRKDIRNPAIHAYWNLHVIWGRKPEAKEKGPAAE